MKKIITAATVMFFVFVPFFASALVQVDGYYRDDGTYVEPHYRSEPDGIESNNLGSDGIDVDNDGYGAGSVNPYYRDEIDSSSLYDSYYDTYNSFDSGYDSYESTYDSYDYDSLDSYETDYGSSYDSTYNSYDSYDYDYSNSYDSSYDSYDTYNSYDYYSY